MWLFHLQPTNSFSAVMNCFRDCLFKEKNCVRKTVPISQGGKVAQFHLVSTETKRNLRVRAQEPAIVVNFESVSCPLYTLWSVPVK